MEKRFYNMAMVSELPDTGHSHVLYFCNGSIYYYDNEWIKY